MSGTECNAIKQSATKQDPIAYRSSASMPNYVCVCVRARVHRDACLCPVSGRAPSSTETGCVPLRDAIPPPKNKLLAQFQWSALVSLPCSIAPCFCAVCFVLHNDGPSRKTPVLLLFGGSGFAVVLFEPNRTVPFRTKQNRIEMRGCPSFVR